MLAVANTAGIAGQNFHARATPRAIVAHAKFTAKQIHAQDAAAVVSDAPKRRPRHTQKIKIKEKQRNNKKDKLRPEKEEKLGKVNEETKMRSSSFLCHLHTVIARARAAINSYSAPGKMHSRAPTSIMMFEDLFRCDELVTAICGSPRKLGLRLERPATGRYMFTRVTHHLIGQQRMHPHTLLHHHLFNPDTPAKLPMSLNSTDASLIGTFECGCEWLYQISVLVLYNIE